jgi:hypothetical protein
MDLSTLSVLRNVTAQDIFYKEAGWLLYFKNYSVSDLTVLLNKVKTETVKGSRLLFYSDSHFFCVIWFFCLHLGDVVMAQRKKIYAFTIPVM